MSTSHMSTSQQACDDSLSRLILIPSPVNLDYTGGDAEPGPVVTIVEDTSVHDPDAVLARQLSDECRCDGGAERRWEPAGHRRGGGHPVRIVRADGLDEDTERLYDEGAVIMLGLDPGLALAAYRLDITANDDTGFARVRVTGGSLEGLRCGVQTLRQILRQTPQVWPCVHIEDAPAFAVRSYSLDVTRGRVPTLGFLMWFADQLAFYKYNQFQLYVEHTFAFPELSEAWRGTDPLTADDIIRLDEHCARLGIELVPSLACFGHMYMNLRTRSHRRLGEFPEDADRPFSFVERMEHHTLNAAEPESLAFAGRLIGQYAPLFRSRSFNIGGDETFDLGRGRSAPFADVMGAGELYARFVRGLCGILDERGLKPMMWADIALESPRTMRGLPKDVTLLNWMYEPDIDEEKIRTIAELGLRQFVCPAVRAWSRFLPDYEGAWLNIHRMAVAGRRWGAAGIVVTDWGDYGHVNDPRLSLPGLCYGAQNAWNPVELDFGVMNERISRFTYHDNSGCLMAGLSKADRGVSFPWDLAVQLLELDAGDGSLNTDVAAYVERAHAGEPLFDRDADCADARRRLLLRHRTRLAAWRDFNRIVDGCGNVAATSLTMTAGNGVHNGGMDAGLVRTMMDAQRLFNRLGGELLAMAGDTADGGAGDGGAGDDGATGSAEETRARREHLAVDLERWFERYREQWLAIGRPAELDRIAHVVWSYADMLRAGDLGSVRLR